VDIKGRPEVTATARLIRGTEQGRTHIAVTRGKPQGALLGCSAIAMLRPQLAHRWSAGLLRKSETDRLDPVLPCRLSAVPMAER